MFLIFPGLCPSNIFMEWSLPGSAVSELSYKNIVLLSATTRYWISYPAEKPIARDAFCGRQNKEYFFAIWNRSFCKQKYTKKEANPRRSERRKTIGDIQSITATDLAVKRCTILTVLYIFSRNQTCPFRLEISRPTRVFLYFYPVFPHYVRDPLRVLWMVTWVICEFWTENP